MFGAGTVKYFLIPILHQSRSCSGTCIGIYFAEHSSKSNQYVYGIGGGSGCPEHKEKSCYLCTRLTSHVTTLSCDVIVMWHHHVTILCIFRKLLLCRVTLGKPVEQFAAIKIAHAPPGHHSVIGRPSAGGLNYPEYVIYRGEQVQCMYSSYGVHVLLLIY